MHARLEAFHDVTAHMEFVRKCVAHAAATSPRAEARAQASACLGMLPTLGLMYARGEWFIPVLRRAYFKGEVDGEYIVSMVQYLVDIYQQEMARVASINVLVATSSRKFGHCEIFNECY
jgi:hypothetical protein